MRARTISLLKLTAMAAALASIGSVLVGCGGGTKISPTLFNRLSRDARMAVYDRENDIVIAKSRLDEARRAGLQWRDEKSQLKDRSGRMEARIKKAGGKGLEAALKMVDARREYLTAMIKATDAQEKFARTEVAAGNARLEYTWKQQLVRFGLIREGVLEPLQASVKSAEEKARKAQRRELDLRTEAQKVFLNWKTAEEAYVAVSGDFDAGVWID